MKALRLSMFIVLVAAVATLPAPATTPSATPDVEGTGGIPNWTAPPYWTPPGEGNAPSPQSAREALATTPTSPLPFVAIAPCRVIDTRTGSGFSGSYGPPSMGGGSSRTFVITGQCGIPAGAKAVSFNFAVWAPPSRGGLTVWPSGGTQPNVSTLNWEGGILALANAAIVPLGASGDITVAILGTGTVDIFADVNGYYSSAGVVTTLNGLTGDMTLTAGSNVSITPSGNTLTVASTNSGGTLTGVTAGTGIAVTGGAPSPTVLIPPAGVTADRIATGQVVKSINGATDGVTIQGSGDVTVSTVGGIVTIGAPSGTLLLGVPGDTTLIGAGYTEIAPSRFDYWMPISTAGAPGARTGHVAVWTGSKLIVWGGYNNPTYLNDGGIYDPSTNSWTAMASAGAPAARYIPSAVWTGSKMIVWGGVPQGGGGLSDGGVYDPSGSGSWTATANGGPSARYYHTAVWTGSKMIVWGGFSGTANLNDGGVYDPSGSGSWTATASSGAPTVRRLHVAVWTGSKMLVWGGYGGSYWNDGGVYDPSGSGSWTGMATSGAPQPRYVATAVWTGSKMIVWGGFNSTNSQLYDGGVYDPSGSGSWVATTNSGAPAPRQYHAAAWTGSKMIVWGGCNTGGASCTSNLNDGGQYDPSSNSWFPLTTAGAPAGRQGLTATWTGSKMIVFGGANSTGSLSDGSSWIPMSLYSKN